ncbi:hypothetical protein AB0N05_15965 [Nocardia sp. NPDC051030]|uniref:GAP1-M domain-containing protein n=1 Tax=Nocardia sp. NPDC051030 TaxID=3155162 RepID=UPI0034141361
MTEFPQLLCGWAMVNLEDSGTGVGVVARSGNWPAAVGSTARELGPLVTMPGDGLPATGEVYALEFTHARGVAIASLKTPSSARPGTCITHLIAGDPGVLDGATTLGLYASGGFRTTLNGSTTPTDQWEPAAPTPDVDHDVYATALLDEPWLPELIGGTLAFLTGQGPALALHVHNADDAVTMLRALYGILPRNVLRQLTFSTYAQQTPDIPAIAAVLGANAEPPGDRRVITPAGTADDPADGTLSLGRAIVGNRKAGVALPESLSSVQEIRDWLYQRHLRTMEPALLDDTQLARVLTDPELSPEWFADGVVARRAIGLALEKPSVTKALARINHSPDIRAAFEQALIEHVKSGDRGQARASQVAGQLGFDLSEVVSASAWQRIDSGPLSVSDAKAVWPRIQKEWETADPDKREHVVARLTRHRTLRDFAIQSRDRQLVYETILAEVNDPAVHPGSSHVLHTAMYTNLPIVAQLIVNVSCTSRDRYVLEQLMACTPNDRLPNLILECARYPAVGAAELVRAVTITRSEPAELAAALHPAWSTLRGFLGLPEPVEAMVVLSAAGADQLPTDAERRGFRLPRLKRKENQVRGEISGILRVAFDDPGVIEETHEILSAAIASDIEFVAACMADTSQSPGGASVMLRVFGNAPRDRVPALVTACAQHPDTEPLVLLRAVAALGLSHEELATVLGGGWPWLRTRLDLPERVAVLLVLDPLAAAAPRLKPLRSAARKPQPRWQFWR